MATAPAPPEPAGTVSAGLPVLVVDDDPQVLADARARGMVLLAKLLKPIRLRAAITAGSPEAGGRAGRTKV